MHLTVAAWLSCMCFLAVVATGQQTAPTFSVRVYDTLLQPIAGARVSAVDVDGNVFAEGVSDAEGLWRTAARDGWVYAAATAPGRIESRTLMTRRISSFGRSNVALHLYDAVTLRGTVRDDRGHPVPRAHVAVDVRGWWLETGRIQLPETRCDGSGQFALAGVPLADVHLTAWAEDHVLGQTLVSAGETTADLVLTQGDGCEVELRLDGDEVPADDGIEVAVQLNRRQGMEIRLPAPLRVHRLGATRVVRVSGLPDDGYEVRLRSSVKSDEWHVSPRWTEKLAAEDMVVRFTATKATRTLVPVSGVLRNERGVGLSGITIRLVGAAQEAVLIESDSEGHFRVDVPIEEGGRLSVSLPGSDLVLVEQDPANRRAFARPRLRYRKGADLELVAAASAVVRGRLVMRDGDESTGLAVGIELQDGSFSFMYHHAEVGADGRFELRGFAAFDEPFWLVVNELQGSARVGPLRFEGKRALRGVQVPVVPPTEVRGRVMDGDGRPVAGAWVTLDAPSNRGRPETRDTLTLSGRDGRFVLRGARPGGYQIRAYRKSGASESHAIELAPSKGIQQNLQIVE